MRIAALAPWYGSKRTLAPKIIEQLGDHRAYWEVFCGSASVLLAKERCTYESINDLHGDLINLALCLQDESKAVELYGRVKRVIFHEAMLPMAKAFLLAQPIDPTKPPSVERAFWYLVFSWMGLNGIAGTPLRNTGTFAVRFSANGGNGATRWASVCESIPDWHRRLLGVQILQRDGFELLDSIEDQAGTAIYCDPPYLTKGAKYVHDFESVDHRRLATCLDRFEHTRIVVSYYDHPDLDELYPAPRWSKVACSVAKSMVNSGMRAKEGRTEAPEVLLVNGEPVGSGMWF